MTTLNHHRIGLGRHRVILTASAFVIVLLMVVPAAAQSPEGTTTGDPAPTARDKGALKPSSTCLGPFTPHEMELYSSLAEARQRLVAAEAALTVRERLLDARQLRVAAQLEEIVRLEQKLDAKLALFRQEQATRDADKKALAAKPLSPEETVIRQQRAEQLSAIVKSMQDESAAALLAELPAGLATEVLSKLSARKAGSILTTMDPQTASALSISFIHSRDATPQAGGRP